MTLFGLENKETHGIFRICNSYITKWEACYKLNPTYGNVIKKFAEDEKKIQGFLTFKGQETFERLKENGHTWISI